jgi:hypothetical protein
LMNDSRTDQQNPDEGRRSWGAACENMRRLPKVHEPAGSTGMR